LKYYNLYAIFFCFLLIPKAVNAYTLKACIDEDKREDRIEAAKWWATSSKAIEIFRNGNSLKLEALIQRPLIMGPSKNQLKTKNISQLFTADAIVSIQEAEPICGYFNYMGNFIADGNIWFGLVDGEVKIISIPGAKR